MRNLRIFIDCREAGAVNLALAQVMRTLTAAETVNDPKSADLIIVSDVRTLVSIYDEKKRYAFINMGRERLSMDKPNVTEMSVLDCVVQLVQVASQIELGDDDSKTTSDPHETPASAEKPGASWVLVVDDKPENQESARLQLSEKFNLVVAEGFDQARKMLGNHQFDYALLDLHMPVSTEGALGTDAMAKNLGEDIPYGLFLLLEACQKGANAALVTDLNHHKDPFSAAFDYYSGQAMVINGKNALMLHAVISDGAKDWAWALSQLMR